MVIVSRCCRKVSGWNSLCSLKYSKRLDTVKPVLSGHSKIDKTKVSKTNGSLMSRSKVLPNALSEHSAILLTCIKR